MAVVWTAGLPALPGSERCGLHVEVVGGEGVDGDVFSRDYRMVPLDQRSGYLEGDDVVHRHYWLEIGTERLIFDPTGHQFDDKGGVSRDRYVVDGLRGGGASRTSAANIR